MGLRNYANNIIDGYITSRGYSKAHIPQPIRPQPSRILSGEAPPVMLYSSFVESSETEFQKLAMANYTVYRNIMLIGRIVSEATLLIEEEDTEVEGGWSGIPVHDFLRIFEVKPNPIMSQSFIWQYQMAWLLLKGEAYWMLAEDVTGELRQTYPLPANLIRPIPNPDKDADKPILGYAYTPSYSHEVQFIDPRYIVFHRFPNPFEYYRGLSPLSAYVIGLQTNTEAQRTDLEDFINRLRLQHLLSLPLGTDQYEFDIALADLEESEAQGRRWKLIRAGDMKSAAISKGRDQFSSEIYNITEHQANAIYGVPDGIWDKDANRASAQEHRATLIENTIWPILTMLAEDLTVNVVVPFYGEGLRTVFDDIRPRNVKQDLEIKDSKRESQTFDEGRKDDGFDPHSDNEVGNAPYNSAGDVYKIKVMAASRPADANIRDVSAAALNGNQVEAAKEIILQYVAGAIDRPTASNMLQIFFNFDEAQALSLLSDLIDVDEALEIAEGVTPSSTLNGMLAIQKRMELHDYRSWKGIALRIYKRGDNPGDYEFESQYISNRASAAIHGLLRGATSVNHIKAIFTDKAIPFEAAGEYEDTIREEVDKGTTGDIDQLGLEANLTVVIPGALLTAFRGGLETDDDLTDEQQEFFDDAVASSLVAIPLLARDTFDGKFTSIDEEPPTNDLDARIKKWGSVALGLFAIGRMFKSEDVEELMWVVGPTDHCNDCAGFNGQVKTGREWLDNTGLWPQSRSLECKGYNCLCIVLVVENE